MKILVCPDKFKGSLTAREVCNAVASGITRRYPDAVIETVPLADGGEGTCKLLTEWHDGKEISLEVHDPLFRSIMAHYGISNDGQIAFIEMAEASGLSLLRVEERNPLVTTTVGTGEMIANALDRGVRKIILGIGGSATNDAGIGMASALGYSFFDATGVILKPTGENLIHIHHLTKNSVHPRLKEVSVIALCDVTNALYGPGGAAYVYGPQKGADKAALEILDAGLRNFKRVVKKSLKTSVDFPGAGAAGGLGAGAKAFLNASMEKGVNYIIENTGLTAEINAADIIITGEGKLDGQTFSGKVVSEVLNLAEKAGKPVVAICGVSEISHGEAKARGLTKVISLVDEHTSPESAMRDAAALITRKVTKELETLPGF